MFLRNFFKKIKEETQEIKILSAVDTSKREVFIVGEITIEKAESIVDELLLIDSINNQAPIWLYIDSSGGSVTAGIAIVDTIKYLKSDVITICNGKSCGIATFILSSAKKGLRFCIEDAKISLCEISTDITRTKDINKEIKRTDDYILKILVDNLGQTIGRIKEDRKYWSSKRDHYLTSNEAIAYGIVDKIYPN